MKNQSLRHFINLVLTLILITVGKTHGFVSKCVSFGASLSPSPASLLHSKVVCNSGVLKQRLSVIVDHKLHNSHLFSSSESEFEKAEIPTINRSSLATISNVNKLVIRSSWLSWWFQIVLSVISGVILTFANTVRKGGNAQSLWSSGFAFSTIGVVIAFLNAGWTWSITRLSRRITANKIQPVKVFPTILHYCRISVILSLVGMFVTLLGAEQIVGTLASKVLGQGSGFYPIISPGSIGTSTSALQALDIFLVQANTNVMVAHFAPLTCYLWLQTQIPRSNIQEGATNNNK